MAHDRPEGCLALVGLGSNVEPRRHLGDAVLALAAEFRPLRISGIYESPDETGAGPPYWNLVVELRRFPGVDDLAAWLKTLEGAAGRRRGDALVTLDADLLYFRASGTAPVLHRQFLAPYWLAGLQDLVPGLRHPEDGLTLAEHWRAWLAEGLPLPVAVRGRLTSHPQSPAPIAS